MNLQEYEWLPSVSVDEDRVRAIVAEQFALTEEQLVERIVHKVIYDLSQKLLAAKAKKQRLEETL